MFSVDDFGKRVITYQSTFLLLGLLHINSFEVSATSRKIVKLKQTLQKYKEDVEQVELFKMQRDDYEEKIQLCANLVLQLRELEAQLNQPTNN